MGIWREYLIEKLADRERAIGYLQAILDDYQIDRSRTVVLRALQTVVEAQGGVSELAKQTDMDPQVLSKVLSNSDIPLIDALGTVLGALGYQLSIKPLTHENSNLETDTDELKARNASAHVAESPTSLQ
jgi:DNA-binding phage protein